MAITSRNVSKKAAIAMEAMSIQPVNGVVSQAAVLASSVTIPYPFQIVSVELFTATTTATISYDVQIGAVTALATPIVPVAATKVAGVLSATQANTRSQANSGVLNLRYTSNGSGVSSGVSVTVWIRPYGMKGDAYDSVVEFA